MDTFSPRTALNDPQRMKDLERQARRAMADWYKPENQADDAARIRQRNKIMETQVRLADAYFIEYEREFMRGRARTDLVLDIATLFSAGAATVARGEKDKTAFAAIAAFLTGSKLAIDANLYFKQTTPAIAAKMRSLRARKYNEILLHLQNGGDVYRKYTIADAEHDIAEYFQAGTVHGAISDISEQAERESKLEDAKRTAILAVSFDQGDQAAIQRVSAWLDADPANRGRFDDFAAAEIQKYFPGEQYVPVRHGFQFIHDEKFRQFRKDLINRHQVP